MQSLTGTIDEALKNASFLLLKSPEAAIEQASEILKAAPDHVGAQLLRARALRAGGKLAEAEQFVRQMLVGPPRDGRVFRELALIAFELNNLTDAMFFAGRAVSVHSNDAGAWALLADLHTMAKQQSEAASARATSIAVAPYDAECLAAAAALTDGDFPEAEKLLRLRLRDFPSEVTTIRMMAELATRLDRFQDAEKLLRRALEITPSFRGARELLARNLQRSNRPVEALDEVEFMLANEPEDPSLLMLKGSLLVRVGNQDDARQVYDAVLRRYPRQATAWMSLGHVLKTLGQQKEGVRAYRCAIEERPTLGEAWWSLANLKTFQFTPDDIAAMNGALVEARDDEDRFHLHFALGKACEDGGRDEEAIGHWLKGNALRRATLPHDADENHENVQRSMRYFGPTVLNAVRGHDAGDPIFILGMPRSGSTLVEQILASHSKVEGTMELPDMMEIAGRLSAQAKGQQSPFPEFLSSLSDQQLRNLGREYIERTRVHRKTDRPYFIDKMPNNWAHIGLIRLILPKAHIIDARRHPVGCCLSIWKQHFARGQAFSYDLTDLARYYCDYVDLTAHFDEAAPGLVHRVIYERMVADSEAEVRKLLDFLGLPFEQACLEFWQNRRAVRTASSEQVRKPIFSDAVDHWRRFEPWLGTLIDGLRPALRSYPNAAVERDVT